MAAWRSSASFDSAEEVITPWSPRQDWNAASERAGVFEWDLSVTRASTSIAITAIGTIVPSTIVAVEICLGGSGIAVGNQPESGKSSDTGNDCVNSSGS